MSGPSSWDRYLKSLPRDAQVAEAERRAQVMAVYLASLDQDCPVEEAEGAGRQVWRLYLGDARELYRLAHGAAE